MEMLIALQESLRTLAPGWKPGSRKQQARKPYREPMLSAVLSRRLKALVVLRRACSAFVIFSPKLCFLLLVVQVSCSSTCEDSANAQRRTWGEAKRSTSSCDPHDRPELGLSSPEPCIPLVASSSAARGEFLDRQGSQNVLHATSSGSHVAVGADSWGSRSPGDLARCLDGGDAHGESHSDASSETNASTSVVSSKRSPSHEQISGLDWRARNSASALQENDGHADEDFSSRTTSSSEWKHAGAKQGPGEHEDDPKNGGRESSSSVCVLPRWAGDLPSGGEAFEPGLKKGSSVSMGEDDDESTRENADVRGAVAVAEIRALNTRSNFSGRQRLETVWEGGEDERDELELELEDGGSPGAWAYQGATDVTKAEQFQLEDKVSIEKGIEVEGKARYSCPNCSSEVPGIRDTQTTKLQGSSAGDGSEVPGDREPSGVQFGHTGIWEHVHGEGMSTSSVVLT